MIDRKRIFSAALAVLLIFMQLSLFCGVEPAMLTDPIGDGPLPEISRLQLGDGEASATEPTEVTSPTEPTEEPRPDVPQTEPETGTSDKETLPDVPETEPETGSSNEEPLPNDPETKPDTGNNDEGQEDGIQGEEGGEEAELDLGLVLTWYRYGSEAATIVCGPSETVQKSLNTVQLVNSELRYRFSLTGAQSEGWTIRSAEVRSGDGAFTQIETSGSIPIELPDGGTRAYTLRVCCQTEAGEELIFTYVLNCSHGVDLELELHWQEKNGREDSLRCAPNDTAAKTVKSRELTEHVFGYSVMLAGGAADGAKLLRGSYTTASGLSGELDIGGGTLVLQPGEAYDLTFEAEYDGMTLFFRFKIDYTEAADVTLSFTWLERGSIPRTLLCQPDGQTAAEVRSNQLSAGAVKYEIALTGEDAENARILNISCNGRKLEQTGAIPMELTAGASETLYTVTVSVLVSGQQLRYEVVLRYSMDVSLEMSWSLLNGEVRTVLCENGKTRTAEPVYDDELAENLLDYEMKLTGSAGEGLTIRSVRCFQSGSGRTTRLEAADSVQLLLKNGRTGENTFTVTAGDAAGTEYKFTISIPYKHRGERTVKIAASLSDGQTIINGAPTNLSVRAWTEDGAGNVTGHIPANGVDTKLIVTFDGERVSYISTSGNASEYILNPKNPDVGDKNEHILHIYAEDAYGNYGELTLRLRGQRNQSGQKTGSATIQVDMTVMGLGIVDSVRYEVLADEPISYSIAKAVFGMDLGTPYGAARDTMGWKARYNGTLDEGFYLTSLTPGITGKGLGGGSWSQYGSNEAEILASIDSQFGKGTGLATLWRCIYRNGLNKSSGSGGTYGEFDYTSGSGWLFSLNGVYYPGLSMCQYALEDGDVLTLRYSLAYGWDVGGGTNSYGNSAGYCVTALNGSFTIDHRMETVEQEDGSRRYICRCCGLIEACTHDHTVYQDLGDGSHIRFCEDCRTVLGDPQEHGWAQNEDVHTCTACGVSEDHRWKEAEGSNTATCTEPGVRTVYCLICGMVREEASPPKGHALNSRWNHTKTDHYQKCSVCLETIPESVGQHRYEYHAGDDDWYCTVCEAGHDWDYCGNAGLTIQSASCVRILYRCGECGLELTKNGHYPEYHAYENGVCLHCGAADPSYAPPTEPPVTEPPETEPPETEPPETEPPETEPPVTEPPTTEPPVTEPPETEPPTEPTRKNRRNYHESQNR